MKKINAFDHVRCCFRPKQFSCDAVPFNKRNWYSLYDTVHCSFNACPLSNLKNNRKEMAECGEKLNKKHSKKAYFTENMEKCMIWIKVHFGLVWRVKDVVRLLSDRGHLISAPPPPPPHLPGSVAPWLMYGAVVVCCPSPEMAAESGAECCCYSCISSAVHAATLNIFCL